LIRWGYYGRQALPSEKSMQIQRVRCKKCGRTTNVLPSFLLVRKSYSVKALKKLVLTFIKHPDDWNKILDISIDLATAYRWLKVLAQQARKSLPEIRKEILNIQPDYPLRDYPSEPVLSNRIIIRRFLAAARQLFQAAVRLVDKKEANDDALFCFLNYFLAKHTGKALLIK